MNRAPDDWSSPPTWSATRSQLKLLLEDIKTALPAARVLANAQKLSGFTSDHVTELESVFEKLSRVQESVVSLLSSGWTIGACLTYESATPPPGGRAPQA